MKLVAAENIAFRWHSQAVWAEGEMQTVFLCQYNIFGTHPFSANLRITVGETS